ncbi:MAG: hypothetical protein M5R36_08775 [Deltaproteobacteria bacterium]|nr:hypothetical protein [Deltaproteobacteria bacterium]
MPFLAAALAPVFAAGKRLRRAAAGLAAVSVAVTLMVVSVNPFGPQIASMTNPIIQYVAPNFTSGVLSINNLAPFPPEPKLYPDELLSLEKPEEWWSSYNLGELLGYGGLLSLAPLIAWWGLAGFLAFKMLPRPEHATERAT